MNGQNGHADSIDRFSKVARRYCSWAETQPGEPRAEVQTALKLLSNLYSAALELPEAKPTDVGDEFEVPLDEWKSIYRRFGHLPIDNYSELFDQSQIPAEEPVVGSVADDLADVYRDLVQGVRLEDAGRQADALWQWQMNFHIHWGRHASSALHVLHCFAEKNYEW